MPRSAPYVPGKQNDLVAWAVNFAGLITGSPSSYGLTAADAVNIQSAVDSFVSAMALVTSPSSRTPDAVSAKDTARVVMLAVVRPYAQNISLNAGVTSANKIALGVNPRTNTPSPISAPASNPVLTVQSAANLSIVLRYRDSAASPSVKSKPYGAAACEIGFAVSATPVTDPTALTSHLSATKSPLVVKFDPSAGGKQAYFAARWRTQAGLYSPWSPLVGFTVPVGG